MSELLKYLSKHNIQLKYYPYAIGDTPPASGVYSVKQAAKQLGVSKETVYGLCASGELDCTKIGRRITITQQHLDAYRQSH